MTKKIIITFNNQPNVGVGIDFFFTLDGMDFYFPNGKTNVEFDYQLFGGGDPELVELQSTLGDTINYTLAFLNANYSSPGIVYERVNNTIEMSLNFEQPEILVYLYSINDQMEFSSEDITTISTVGLKYFLQYKNLVNDTYFCEIFQKGFTGIQQEINGKIILEKASVNNLLDPIRGGGATLQLEATKDLTLEDLYTEKEQEFTVRIYKNNKILFIGYLNPDGVYQDYVRDEWRITLDCVDGLGALSNLSFVQENGLHFTGKMLAIDIIYYCLKRTGLAMPVNTSVNILYEGSTLGFDVFRTIYLDANRFKKVDDQTIMSCEEVLKSILDIFKACITQLDGEWYIYKPNEIYLEPIVDFFMYDITNNYKGTKKVNLNKKLGSQIDNFYPHHCGGNQRIDIKGSIGGFRINYKYGFVAGLLPNPQLIKNTPDLEYDGWDILDSTYLLNDPLKDKGFYFKNQTSFSTLNPSVKTNPGTPVTIGDQMSFTFTYDISKMPQQGEIMLMEIKHGTKYLVYLPKDKNIPFDDIKNAIWSTDPLTKFRFFLPSKTGTITINMPPMVVDGDLTIGIVGFDSAIANSTTYIGSLDVKPIQSAGDAIGEFHTVERENRVSTIVKPNQTVYNGDNDRTIYMGSIFNEALEPTGENWSRKNDANKHSILQIAAEEELRIAQKPTKKFTGDFYGYIPYLSLIDINNIGKFMPIEWSYDTTTNITTCKQLELFVAEIPDIVYKKTYDYGETVKPTIK